MKKYLLNLLIGLFFILIGDFLLGITLRHFYFSQKNGVYGKANYSIENTNNDILIFGSSRANHHYDTKIISASTGLSVYNTGRDGHFIFYQTAVLKATLERYTPRLIILDFAGTFEFRQTDYDRISSLLPYYKSHKEIRDIVELKSPYEKYKLLSSSYPFNSTLSPILVSKFRTTNDENLNDGYTPLFGNFSGNAKKSIDKSKHKDYLIDKNKYRVFEEFLQLINKKNIPLVVLNSPMYYKNTGDFSVEICKNLCKKHDIFFKDFSNDSLFLKNKNLFDDATHLNSKGASLFTKKVMELPILHNYIQQ